MANRPGFVQLKQSGCVLGSLSQPARAKDPSNEKFCIWFGAIATISFPHVFLTHVGVCVDRKLEGRKRATRGFLFSVGERKVNLQSSELLTPAGWVERQWHT